MKKLVLLAVTALLTITQTTAFADEQTPISSFIPDFAEINACDPKVDYIDYSTQQVPVNEEFCLSSESFTTFRTDHLWSGIIAADRTQDIIEVKGRFTTPQSSDTCSNSAWGAWIGLGGYFQPRLIQMGIEPKRNIWGGYQYQLWVEYLNDSRQNPAILISSRVYDPGVSLLLSVSYNKSTHKALFYAQDSTGASPFSSTTTLDLSQYYDGSSAEWISEKRLPNYPIYDFNAMSYNDDQVKLANGDWKNMGDEALTALTLTNAANTPLAGELSSTIWSSQFINYFYQCQ